MVQLRLGRAAPGGASGFDGDVEQMVLYAGESRSLIDDITPAAEIVRDFEQDPVLCGLIVVSKSGAE